MTLREPRRAYHADIVDRLRGGKAQRTDAAALCAEAADEICKLRQRYAVLRRSNTLALREMWDARQRDDALGQRRDHDWVPVVDLPKPNDLEGVT